MSQLALIHGALQAAVLALSPISSLGVELAPPVILSSGLEHVIYPGETGQIRVGTQEHSVAWTLRDFSGKVAGTGEAPAREGVAVIVTPTQELGYYTVDLVVPGQASVAQTSWAVVRRLENVAPGDSAFGVMSHFAQGWKTDVIPLMRKGGIVNARDEAYWDQVEPQRGVFSFPKAFDDYILELGKWGIAPLLPLTFGNLNYDGGTPPHTDDGLNGYANYAGQAVRHYGAPLRTVEIWNEYNGSAPAGLPPGNRPNAYTAMLKRAYQAIKLVRPDVMVLGGGTINVPLPYFEQMFQAGALAAMDAVSVHPYRYTEAPEGMETDLLELGQLVRRYNHGATKPIWITEIGWPVRTDAGPGSPALSEATQAKYLARAFSLCLMAGAERVFWYLLRDYANYPALGLLHDDYSSRGHYTPRPAFVAYAVITRQLARTQFVRREPSAPEVYSLLFDDAGKTTRVMWALEPTVLEFHAGSPLRVVNLVGSESLLTPENGTIQVALGDAPIYLLGEALPPAPPPPARKPRVISDSAASFSGTQGLGGWSYGIYSGPASQGDRFRLMPVYRTTEYRAEWADGAPSAQVSAQTLHPGSFPGGDAAPAVRRWTSDVQETLVVSGELAMFSNAGDGVNASVMVDGACAFSRKLGGGQPISSTYSIMVAARRGTIVDLVVDPGEAGEVAFDETKFTAIITSREPAEAVTVMPASAGSGERTPEMATPPVASPSASPGATTAAPRPPRIIADSSAGFSAQQRSGGWEYGVYSGPGTDPGRFRSMPTYRAAPDRGEWADGAPFALVSALTLHPGTSPGGPGMAAVRRWTSMVEGSLTVAGEIMMFSPAGDGINATIWVDGEVAYSRKLGGGQATAANYSIIVQARIGTTIDFVVEPGPSGDVSFDETKFTTVVTRHD